MIEHKQQKGNKPMRTHQITYEQTGLDRTYYVEEIETLPFEHDSSFTKFYKVYSYKNNEHPVMYLAKGLKGQGFTTTDARQIVPFYVNGEMSGTYGENFVEAIKLGFQRAIFNMQRI